MKTGTASSTLKRYEVKVWIFPADENGSVAIVAAHLPGVATYGETVDDAIQNLKEAFQVSAESYLEDGSTIPWRRDEGDEAPEPGCFARWVVVDVETPRG